MFSWSPILKILASLTKRSCHPWKIYLHRPIPSCFHFRPVQLTRATAMDAVRSKKDPIRLKADTTRAKTHFKVVQYIMEAAVKLQLESVTTAAACTIYHRFFSVCELSNYDPHLIGATAIYLATKVEEQPCKLRDIINVCYRILHRKDQPLEVGKTYWELRESIVNCELLLIRFLQYNPKVTLPHKYLVHYMKSLKDWMNDEVWNTVPLCTTAWAMLRDSYHCDMCLRIKPQHLAVSVLYFTMQCYGVEVPLNDQAKVPWWKVFSEEIIEEEIRNIIEELIDMYDMETKV